MQVKTKGITKMQITYYLPERLAYYLADHLVDHTYLADHLVDHTYLADHLVDHTSLSVCNIIAQSSCSSASSPLPWQASTP